MCVRAVLVDLGASTMLSGVSVFTAVVAPVAMVIFAAASLNNLVSLLKLVSEVARQRYAKGSVMASFVQPVFNVLNKILYALFGAHSHESVVCVRDVSCLLGG